MRVLGVIPARYASSRFPGKALADLQGKPLIQHVYERARQAKTLDDLVVATDDRRILQAVMSFGGQGVMTSPGCPSGTDRVAEVARDEDYDLVVNIQGDEPLIHPAMIDQAVAPLIEDAATPMGTLARLIDQAEELFSPHVVKVVINHQGFALYFSRALIPFPRELYLQRGGDLKAAAPELLSSRRYYKHIGLYVYRRDFLLHLSQMPSSTLERAEGLEQLRVLQAGYPIKVAETQYDSLGVDTPEDLERVRGMLL